MTSKSSFFSETGQSPTTAPSDQIIPTAASSAGVGEYLRVNIDRTGYELRTPSQVKSDLAIAYTDVSGLATVAHSGAYSDLTGKPTLSAVALSGAYSDLTGKPTLATVATSGLYSDLTGTPTLGTAAALNVGTAASQVVQLNGTALLPPVDGSLLTNLTYGNVTGRPTLATVATSGAYSDLTGKPTLGSVAALNIGVNMENDGSGSLVSLDGGIGFTHKLRVTRTDATHVQVAIDRAVTGTALNGIPIPVASVNLALNIGATGAGGMDTGSATASADLSVYLITGPAVAAALLGVLGSTSNGTIYSGLHMPAGYTASLLVSSLKMNASAQFPTFFQAARTVYIPVVVALLGGTATTYTSASLASIVPANAQAVGGYLVVTAGTSSWINVASDANGSGEGAGGPTGGFTNFHVALATAQTVYYKVGGSGSPAGNVDVSSYEF